MECEDQVDVWMLGLCYFVHIILFRTDPLTAVEPYWFELVENEEKFFSHPWGKLTFENTIQKLNGDIAELARNIPLKKEMKLGETSKVDEKKKKKKRSKGTDQEDEEEEEEEEKLMKKASKSYMVHGLAIALQYWAYKAIPGY